MHEFDEEIVAPADGRRRPSQATSPSGPTLARSIADGSTGALSAESLLHLQRTAGNASVAGLLGEETDAPVHRVLESSSGEALGAPVRSEMEAALGADFSDVRVHRGGEAASSASSVQARAYTVGSDVVLGDDVDPSSAAGRKTLAHELTHVVQQRTGPVDGTPAPGGIRVSSPGDPFEQAAETTADAIVGGGSAPMPARPAGVSGPSAQRQAAPEDEEEPLQGEFVQRAAVPEEEEEEPLQGEFVQRAAAPEDEDELPDSAT